MAAASDFVFRSNGLLLVLCALSFAQGSLAISGPDRCQRLAQ